MHLEPMNMHLLKNFSTRLSLYKKSAREVRTVMFFTDETFFLNHDY